MMEVWRDTFTGADGTLLQNHAPDVGVGPYVKEYGLDAVITGNQLVMDHTGGFTNSGYNFGAPRSSNVGGVEVAFAIPVRGTFFQLAVRLSNGVTGKHLSLAVQCFASGEIYVVEQWIRGNGNGLIFSLQTVDETARHAIKLLAAGGAQWVYFDDQLVLFRRGTDIGIFGVFALQMSGNGKAFVDDLRCFKV